MLFTKIENISEIRRCQHSVEDINWAKNVKDVYTWTDIPCLHVLAGRVSAHKVCTKNYECYHCAYDQWLADQIEHLDMRQ